MAKVLVIDDDADARYTMTEMLKRVGHEPHAASNPAEAIHAALTFKPDVLVADWVIKPLDTGLDVAQTLRAAHPSLGLVFITGRAPEEVDAEACDLQPYRIVKKPCEFYQLFEAVQSVAPYEVSAA